MERGTHLESAGCPPSNLDLLPALAKTSTRFRSAFSDLLIAHIDDVTKLKDEVKVLREQISNTKHDSSPLGVQGESHRSQNWVDIDHPHYQSSGEPHRQYQSSGEEVRPSELMTFAEREDMAKQAAHQASSPEVGTKRRSLSSSRWREAVSVSETALPYFTELMIRPSFELFFGLLIVSNSVFMTIHTAYESAHIDEPHAPWPLYAIRYCYTFLFTVEWFVRLLGQGCHKFVMGRSAMWNYLDTVVVIASWLEFAADIISFAYADGSPVDWVNLSNTRAFRILRVARLVKVLKIGHLLAILRPLRVLVLSTVGTLRTVLWALLLLLIIMYVFGMVFSQAVVDHRRKNKGQGIDGALDLYWGSLPKSMFTLFKTITGGLDWHDCVLPLDTISDFPWLWILVFIIYIFTTTFAAMNVLTGVFCQSAIEGTQIDRDIVTQKHLEIKQVYIDTIREVFRDIDTDGSEKVTLEEFEAHFQDDKARAFFSSLEIEATDAFQVFRLIDEGGGALDVEDFVHGCLRLRGNARSLEIAKLEHMAKHLDQKVVKILKIMNDLKEAGCLASRKLSGGLDSTSADELERVPAAHKQAGATVSDIQPLFCAL